MLQENKSYGACMYAHTSFDTYSNRYVLGLLLCAGVIGLCCAVLKLAVKQHTRTYYCCTGVAVYRCSITRRPIKKMENKGSTLLNQMLQYMLALANSMLVSVGVWYVRGRKDSKARHSTARHGRARHRTAPHGAVPSR